MAPRNPVPAAPSFRPAPRLQWTSGQRPRGVRGFFLIVPLYASGALRRVYAQPLRPVRSLRPALFTVILFLAIAAQLILLAAGAGDRSGFAACYQSAIPQSASRTCERSYENPFFRGGVTRVDDAIAFDPTTWNLSFFNALHFNYYRVVKGNYDRARLPFTARWRGEIERPRAHFPVTLTYIGEGTLRIDGMADVQLPPAYRRGKRSP